MKEPERDEPVSPEASAQTPRDGRKSLLDRLWPRPSANDDDAHVMRWKREWASGAEARWAGKPPGDNPHDAGSPFAMAWRAGWRWADQQPNRREPSVVRFAVPQRRASDRVSPLRRSAQAGAVGLSALALASWLWQMRRRKKT